MGMLRNVLTTFEVLQCEVVEGRNDAMSAKVGGKKQVPLKKPLEVEI